MAWTVVRRLPALFACSAMAFAARPAGATVVWTSTFEKGDLSEWTPGVNATKGARKNVEVLGEQVYSGKFACKITVHPDDLFSQYVQDRVDIQHQSTLTAEGKDTWVSGHYMMPADAGMRNEFAFWESNGSSQNVMDFWVEPKAGGGTTINFGVGFLGATKIWTADFTIGRWHQVAIHVHWSVNAQLGSVDVWYDGQQVVTAYKAKTKADGNSLFYQNGLHRRRPDNFVDTIYFDDFVEADSFAEARIAAPVQPGEDGGAAGGAGGGDGADAGGGPETTGSADGGGPAGTGGAPGSGGASGGGTGGIAGGGSGGSGGKAATGDGGGGVTGAGSGVTGGGCAIAGRDPAELGAAGSLCFCLAAAAFAFGRRRAAR